MMFRFGNFSSRIVVPKVIASHFRVGISAGFTSMRPCSSSSQQHDDPDHLKKLASAFAKTAKENYVCFRTPHVVETILDILEAAKSPEALASMGSTIAYTMAWSNETRKHFRTPRAAKIVLDALSRSTTPESVANMSWAIYWITNYSLETKKLYSTPEAVKIILDVFHRANTADSAYWMAIVVGDIVDKHPERQKAFTTPQTVPAFKSIIPLGKDDSDSVGNVADALYSLVNNNQAAIELFGTQDFLDVFKSMKAVGYDKYHGVLAILEAEVKRKNNKKLQLPLEIEQLEKEIVSLREHLEAKEKVKKEKQTEFENIKL